TASAGVLRIVLVSWPIVGHRVGTQPEHCQHSGRDAHNQAPRKSVAHDPPCNQERDFTTGAAPGSAGKTLPLITTPPLGRPFCSSSLSPHLIFLGRVDVRHESKVRVSAASLPNPANPKRTKREVIRAHDTYARSL